MAYAAVPGGVYHEYRSRLREDAMSSCVSGDGQTGRGKSRKPADAGSTRDNSHEVAPYDSFDMSVLAGMTSASGRYRHDPAPEQISA
jgi:hypothetical protein